MRAGDTLRQADAGGTRRSIKKGVTVRIAQQHGNFLGPPFLNTRGAAS